MNRRQTRIAKSLVKAEAFAAERVADFTHTPPHDGDEAHAEALVDLRASIENLGGKQAIQESGEFEEESAAKELTRKDVEDTLRSVNRNVGAISRRTKNPAIMERFRMPHGNGDTELRAKLRAFAKAITELGLAGDLKHRGCPQTAASLEAAADAFQEDSGEQSQALAKQAGATASLPEALRLGTDAVADLDAIYHNRFRDNAAMLGAWKTASHVERAPKKSKPSQDDKPADPPKPKADKPPTES